MDQPTIDRPITVDEACALRLLLFGDTKKTFGSAWMQQSFTFDNNDCLYKLVQKKPGPCGLLAAVQACVIYEVCFGPESSLDPVEPTVDMKRRQAALVRALSFILLQASRYSKVFVTVKGRKEVFDEPTISGILRRDGMLEYLRVKVFCSKKSLEEFLDSVADNLMGNGNGACVTFLYSVILTKGIRSIRREMDREDIHLIGADGFCSQEVVNLLLVGKAISNVFDGDIVLNSGGTETTVHRGIPRRSKIGLLSLYEYHKMLEVGRNYKCPRYPIWLVLTECHFATIFAPSSLALNEKIKGSFLLRYMDTLSDQHTARYLKIEIPEEENKPEEAKTQDIVSDNEISRLERCILTKWPGAKITFLFNR